MDKKSIQYRIEEELAKTKVLLVQYKELTKPIAPENAIGRISRMDAINNKTVNEAALRKTQQKYKNLEIALSNIDDVTFGICRKCNTPIPEGRILLMPQATSCVHCAS
ncbi:MAG: DnaK suppressor protein [Patiriisocius sp.]|jgi:DnaK suppressor protein